MQPLSEDIHAMDSTRVNCFCTLGCFPQVSNTYVSTRKGHGAQHIDSLGHHSPVTMGASVLILNLKINLWLILVFIYLLRIALIYNNINGAKNMVVLTRKQQPLYCCDFRVAQMNVSNEYPFISILWKDSGFVTCIVPAWGGWQPSWRFCLWGGGGHGFPWGSSRDALMKLAVLLLPWLAKSALCTLAWQCWSVVHCPKSHIPKLWAFWTVNWSQVPGPWGGKVSCHL